MNIIPPVFDLLVADTELINLLGELDGDPCVFTSDPVDPDAPRPYVFINPGLALNRRWGGVKLVKGREMHLDIDYAVDNTGSDVLANQIGERIRELLDGEQLTVDDQRVLIADVNGPIGIPSDESVIGRRLRLSYKIL